MSPIRFQPLLLVVSLASITPHAQAQGIPAVSGVLEVNASDTVPQGLPPTLTLRAPDRPAAFYARCVFGTPEQEVVGESEALEAGTPFVLALPADTTARSAECAVVARFANGLSERKPVTMQWKVVEAPAANSEQASDSDDAIDPATEEDRDGSKPAGKPKRSGS